MKFVLLLVSGLLMIGCQKSNPRSEENEKWIGTYPAGAYDLYKIEDKESGTVCYSRGRDTLSCVKVR